MILSYEDFRFKFERMGMSEKFSLEALELIYDYQIEMLEQMQVFDFDAMRQLGDVIGICCEFSEINNITETLKELDVDSVTSLEELEKHTLVLYNAEGNPKVYMNF